MKVAATVRVECGEAPVWIRGLAPVAFFAKKDSYGITSSQWLVHIFSAGGANKF